MKIYGYKDEGLPIEQIESSELAEITINASPEEVRKIARFFAKVADDMDKMGADYSHIHLADEESGFEDSPHFVVFNSEN